MLCDELKAYKADVTIPVYGTIADAEVYLKDKADEAIEELNQAIDKLVGVKKSAEQILQNLLDCGLIKEWYFNGKFNAVLKADDPHLQIAELKKENERLKDKLRHYPMMAALIGSDNKEIRRLKRALYKACSNWALSTLAWLDCIDQGEPRKWSEMRQKCLKKAEEYK